MERKEEALRRELRLRMRYLSTIIGIAKERFGTSVNELQ